MSDTSRRAFLRGGLKTALASAGGLLLPWQGGTALALPDLGNADIPVISGPLPVSAETLELRRILARQYGTTLTKAGREGFPYGHRGQHWLDCQEEYARVADVVLSRPVRTWGQVAEIAEICWRLHPKVWYGPLPGETFGMLSLDGYQSRDPYIGAHRYSIPQRAMPSLIEAILQMGNGERRDPAWAPDEPVLDRRLSSRELDELCVSGRRPGGAHV